MQTIEKTCQCINNMIGLGISTCIILCIIIMCLYVTGFRKKDHFEVEIWSVEAGQLDKKNCSYLGGFLVFPLPSC